MSQAPSLLEIVQGLLERTYGMSRVVHGLGRFVIGEAGFRMIYGGAELELRSAGARPAGARTLVREGPEGLRACIYYPDELIATLEAHPPQSGLDDRNVSEFAVLVEELDHLLCIADRARDRRPLSRFELEMHANVSKHLVLARFLAGSRSRLDPRGKAWLRWHLFHKADWSDGDPEVRQRYVDAARWGMRFLDAMEALRPQERLRALRSFHEASASSKLRLIETLRATA